MSELDLIAQALPHYEERAGQRAMLADCKRAYTEESIALIEAGTGIGKSMAYLIAALTWEGEPTVVATHTIALQEQLLQKDIPFLLKALNIKADVALMKGMSNYLCLRKLHDSDQPNALMAWAQKSEEGSRSEYPFPPEVAAEAESCTHARCPHYKECFFFKAKKKAQEAKLVIANHHLLFADLSIRHATDNYDQPCILPPFNRLIIDEAHHIEDVATNYFADRVSRIGLSRLLARILGKLHTLAKKIALPEEEGDAQHKKLLERVELTLVVEKRELGEQVDRFFEMLLHIVGGEEKRRIERLEIFEKIQPLAHTLFEGARAFCASLNALEAPKAEGIISDLKGLAQLLEREVTTLYRFVHDPLDESTVRWIESTPVNLTLVCAKLEIAPLLKEALFDKLSTVVLCSATLANGTDFSFVKKRLGIEEAHESVYESPFDFQEQALLTTFLDLPEPNAPSFLDQASGAIHRVLTICKGNAFVLFTSYQMLQACKERWSLEYPLLCQGEEERTALLERFRAQEGAVLFGTDSFWEGVDVVGDALRCVILVKLPFRVPSDPLFQARCEAVEKRGESSFFSLALPQATLRFKQGFGRLIRHHRDRGSVVCLDSRLVRKGYGKIFLKNLPTTKRLFGKQEEVLNALSTFHTQSQR